MKWIDENMFNLDESGRHLKVGSAIPPINVLSQVHSKPV